MKIEFRNKTVEINEGGFIIVPHGGEHRLVTDDEVYILLIEAALTLNTGDIKHEMNKTELEKFITPF